MHKTKTTHSKARALIDTVLAASILAGCSGEPDVSNATSTDDYLLFAPIASTTTYLIDRSGEVVHSWSATTRPGLSVHLLDNGDLLRTESIPSTVFSVAGAAGRVTQYSWDGDIVWQFDYADATHHSHHDVAAMPNGHVLLLAWETIPDAIEGGRDPATLPAEGELWADHVVEIEPATNEVVWEWHVWDHTIQDRVPSQANFGVIAEHPELIDVNAGARPQNDWTHINAIAYNAALDQIALSVHGLNELWIIDHGTTTAEAAGHEGGQRGRGGDLLYRWGNPAMHDAGTAADQQLFGMHDVHWIPDGLPGAGNLLVFNNGNMMARPYSSIDELATPLDESGSYGTGLGGYGPDAPTWQYTADPPEAMFAANISSAQRLPDGGTLVCVGPEGRFIEVTADGDEVWSYAVPSAMSSVFRVKSIPASAPALSGRDLTPRGPISR